MELLMNSFFSIDRPTMLFALFLPLGTAMLTIFHYILKKKGRGFLVWRLLCLVPLILSALHYFIYRLHGSLVHTAALYGALYLTSLFLTFWQFLYKKKYGFRIAAAVINLCAVFGFLTIFSIHSAIYTSVNNFTARSYTESFHSTIEAMKREYVLSEWKEIDYDALEREIMPMVEEAEKKQDRIAYGAALMTYAYRFYDGHVSAQAMSDDDTAALCEHFAGNDYGFSMVPLADGSTVAVLTDTDSEAYALGIQDGAVITKWDGRPIKDAARDVECIYPELLTFPVAANEDYLKPVFLAGKADEENEVTFLDESGKEKTVILHSMGSYRTRLETALARFYHNDLADGNFSCKMLTDNCGYLRISAEKYNDAMDCAASLKGEYPEIIEMLDEKLRKLSDSGMDRLVIDLRGNEGGSTFISAAVPALFSKESYFSSGFGKYKNGSYTPLKMKLEVPAGGTYADLPVAVLVNNQCCSSGDGLARNLSELPNVTLMGITSSNGVDQTIGGFCFTTNSEFVVVYPCFMSLDEKGEPNIDTKADRISRVPLKEHIDLTRDAALAIFSGGSDYELDYAVNYLSSQP